MADVRKTAMGSAVDMELLRLANETTIAVGNSKTNARGDQLGPGGKVIKTRAEVMAEYHNLKMQLASHDDEIFESAPPLQDDETQPVIVQPLTDDTPVAESESIPNYTKPRGSFAEAVANETEVKQELLEPLTSRNTPKGVSRI